MASIIKIKRSSTQSAVPAAGSLQAGELAVNLYDRKLYVGNTGGGVTAISGENYRLTSQNAGTGAYIKLLGETASSTNTVLLESGTGISISRESNGSISIAATGETTANEADKLSTPRTIALDGDVSGSVSFDGSANVTITTTIADDSHNHIISNVDGLQDALDDRMQVANTLVLVNDRIQVANALVLINDRLQVANAQSLFVNVSGDTMTGFLTLHADPTSSLHAATKKYVDETAEGLQVKGSAEAATTADLGATYDNGTSGVGATLTIPATATLSIDGWTSWSQYDGVLVKNQTNPEENGRYYVSTVGDAGTAWVLTRCGVCDEPSEIVGAYVFVSHGSTYGGTGWVATVDDVDTFAVGTDDIDWVQFSGAGTYTAGTDLSLDGTEFNLNDNIAANTSGNAATATKLATARAITLDGDVTGTANFDGSAGITITATVVDDSHYHIISNVDGLQDALDDRMQVANTLVLVNDRMQVANVNSLISGVNTNLSQKLGANATVTLAGDVTGSATFSANAITITTTYNNDVVLGTDTSGNYVAGINGTANEIEVSGSGSEGATVTIGLPDDVTIAGQLNVSENIVVTGNTSVGGNLTVDGNLTVEGAVTYISSSTVNVDDSMLKLSANNAADTVDTGVYGMYVAAGPTIRYAGYFRDASDGVFKFYANTTAEPTTTVNTSGTGYAIAQVDAIIDGGTY